MRPARPVDLVEVRRSFAEPIGAADTIKRYIGKLAGKLCLALEERGLGARRLDLICHRVDTRFQAVRAGTAMPLRDPERIARLLGDKVESIDPGFGIEIMTLAVTSRKPKGRVARDVLLSPSMLSIRARKAPMAAARGTAASSY